MDGVMSGINSGRVTMPGVGPWVDGGCVPAPASPGARLGEQGPLHLQVAAPTETPAPASQRLCSASSPLPAVSPVPAEPWGWAVQGPRLFSCRTPVPPGHRGPKPTASISPPALLSLLAQPQCSAVTGHSGVPPLDCSLR